MLGEELSRALSDISDDKIEAAAGIVPKSRNHIWLRVAAVAAVVALVMTWMLWPGKPDTPEDDGVVKAPGMLKVYAFDLTSGEDLDDCERHVLEEGKETEYIGIWASGVSMMPVGLPILLELEEESYSAYKITFDVTSEHGDFTRKYINAATYEDAWLGKQFVIENGETIYWKNREKGKTGKIIDDKGYVDIIIRADGHIIGYTVIKIVRTHPAHSAFAAVLVKNVMFPMDNGEFQQIGEDYVRELMMKER